MSLDEALGLTGAEAADDSIHIDANTRQVTVPESQQLFGVESDENVEVKHIVLDGRYNDGTDLSTLTLRVNWRNANGGKGSYLVTNLDVTEDSIAFDWVISRGVVAYKGTVYFIVCAFKVNSTGKTEQEWNSSLGQGTVLEGLEVTDEDIGGDDTVNRMLTILQQMNSVQTAAKNSADAAAASNKSASDTAGSIKDSLDQIAKNKAAVSQLKEDTAKLKDGKISKFYASSQGNTNLPDSDDGRIVDLMLYGKSEQKQYSGKNLWDMHQALTTGNVKTDGTKYVATAVTMQIDVTPESIPVRPIKIFGGKTYALSMKTTVALEKGRYLCIEYVDGTRENLNYTNSNSIVFTAKKDISLIGLVIYQTSNGDTVWDVQLELGSTATDYEPYVGGIPSPNPEYPQEIKSVVKPVVKVCRKNLLDLRKGRSGTGEGVTYKRNDDGSYTRKGTSTGQSGNVWFLGAYGQETDANTLFVLKPGTYTIKDCVLFSGKSQRNDIFTITNDFFVTGIRSPYMDVGVAIDDTVYPRLIVGSTDTGWEPYTEQTVTLPYTLNAIPVTSGGNITIDGQQYIADYVDIERGKLVRMCKELTFTGSEAWNMDSTGIWTSDNGNSFYTTLGYTVANTGLLSRVAHFIARGLESKFTDNSITVAGGNNQIEFIRTSYKTVSDFKAYLKANPVKVLVAPDTPDETDLTADEIAAFKALVSYYPVTNVSTTSDQLDGHTVFNYPISLAKGYDYLKTQLGDTRDYLYGIDLMTAEAYVNSEYAAALAEIEV